MISLLILHLIFLLLSLAPVLPLTLILDLVTTTMLFKDNPILRQASRTTLTNILERFTAMRNAMFNLSLIPLKITRNETMNASRPSEVLTVLSKLTSDTELFTPSRTFSHYSGSPLCITSGANILSYAQTVITTVIVGTIICTVMCRSEPKQDRNPSPNDAEERSENTGELDHTFFCLFFGLSLCLIIL